MRALSPPLPEPGTALIQGGNGRHAIAEEGRIRAEDQAFQFSGFTGPKWKDCIACLHQSGKQETRHCPPMSGIN